MFLRNQRGQMAIFIALFFQVLFVFFAMAINVGLVVHDKINLQNAVDLAAYYGAAKQAEILNQMAHVNYQMRQNYKLFVWRFRVLGTLGLDNHPYNVRSLQSAPLEEVDVTDPTYSNPIPPVVCVSHFYWHEYNELDPGASLCRKPIQNIPNIPLVTNGGGSLPGFGDLVDYTQRANNQLQRLCLESGILNWMFAARMLTHYRVDGLVRKKMMSKLATQLVSSKDLRDESIEEGVRNTFESNLTNSNLSGLQDFQYLNSMATGSCSEINTWLPEIKINPVIMFTDYDIVGSQNNCTSEVESGSDAVSGVPNRPLASARLPGPGGFNNLPMGLTKDATLQSFYNSASINQLIQHWSGEPSSDLHSSVGFEKNPWCMVYTGVKATTAVQKPFSPTGGSVTLEAHGFAKPFGGRMGPWYGKTWPRESSTSLATNRDQMVDTLLPSRETAGGGASSLNPNDDLANYSRFPGDPLGLKSGRAISSMIQTFKSDIKPQPNGAVANAISPVAWSNYDHLGGLPQLEQTGDSLARDSAIKPGLLRKFELGAATPDWFDALYYSVEPSYYTNYFSDAATGGNPGLPEGERIYDFGSVKDGAQGFNEKNNVMNQATNVQDVYHPEATYVLRDWKNLLTSWHQKSANDYTLDAARFAECGTPVGNDSYPTTGNCIYGGRTGYSVKNVSRDYLLSGDHKLGGSEGATGAIQNPPTF